jgi:hypothetical protein
VSATHAALPSCASSWTGDRWTRSRATSRRPTVVRLPLAGDGRACTTFARRTASLNALSIGSFGSEASAVMI